MPKLPTKTKTKGLRGSQIGSSYADVTDASGKTVIKPKVSRKLDVSAKIRQRRSKRVKPVRRTP